MGKYQKKIGNFKFCLELKIFSHKEHLNILIFLTFLLHMTLVLCFFNP